MTVSAQDAHEYPIYNSRFRLIVPLLDADGDPISPSSPDTELSQDMGTFADATNEATEIATSSGIIYVDLIATELDTKSTVVRVQSTGAKTTVAVLTPRRLPVHRAGTAQAGGNSTITLDTGASAIDDYYNGMWVNITNDTPSGVRGQARKIIDYVGSTKVATIEGTWGTNPSSSSTFEVLIPSDSQYRQSDLVAVAGIANNTALAQVGVNVVTNADKTGYSLTTPQSFNLIGNVSGTLSNVNNVVNPVTVGTNSDKTGYSLSSPQSYHLIGNISGTVSNVTTVLNITNPVTAGNVTGSVFGNVNGSVGSVVAGVGISTGTFIDALVDRVWDEDVDSSHQTAGSAGKKLDDAGSAGDPWGTALNAYAAGTAGNILYTRMPTGAVTVSDKTGFSLSTPQSFNLIGNVSGTVSNVVTTANVTNPVTAGNVTGSVFGNVNGSVNSVTQPVAINTGTFLDALADKVWDEQLSGHLAVGQAGHFLASRMPSGTVLVGDKTGFSLSTPQNFNLVGNISGTLSNVLSVTNPVVAGVVTGSVLGNVNGSVASVTAPVTVGTNSDKTGYSLSSPQAFNLIGNISGTVSNVTTTLNVTNPVTAGNVTGSVFGNVNGSVGSVVTPVGILTGTFFDALVDKVWDEDVDSSHQTAGSAGKKLDDAGSAGDPWGTSLAGYAIGTAGHTLHTRMPTGSVTVSDKTGFSLSSPQTFDLNGTVSNVTTVATTTTVTNPVGISTGSFLLALADAVWDEDVESTHQTAGSAGKKLDDAGSAGDPWNTALPGSYVAGSAGHILASRMPTGTVLVGDKTGFSLSSPQNFNLVGNITGTITNVLNVVNPVVVTGSVVSVTNPVTVGTNNDKTGYGLATGTLLDAIADKVWDEQISSHLTAGSTGDRLDDAGSAGDPWSTNLPGVYATGTAGYIVGQHVDAKISSRQPSGTVTVGSNLDKLGYSLSSPQAWNLIGNISGTVTTVTNLTNAGTVIIGDSDITTIANRVWSSQYSPIRTLTTVAGDAMPPAVGDDVWAVRGDTFVWDITGLDLGHLSKIQFSVKGKYYNDDTESLIFAESGTGLLYIDGVPGTASNAAITYSQVSGTAQIRVEAVEMAKLDVQQAYYDVQIIRTTGTFVSSPLLGNFHVVGDTTRATS